ncbi:MAG: hypothetical protein WD607_03880 [Candidatus Paceibacterota bacterium]
MNTWNTEIIPLPSVEIVQASEVPQLLGQIRPSWKAKNLITRVHRLLKVDPSSACQRLFNAAIHDLREKIIIAGVDIASEAAKQNKLPPINNSEDVENYTTARLIDLAYKMGLITRPEWRRISRCYEIRRDLEHEDDEYEAGIEDCVYIFKTCIEVVLSKDPIHLLKVVDVKDLIEQSEPVLPDETLLQDFQGAPKPRQEEIAKLLTSIALDKEQSDIVQQNAYTFLLHLEPLIHNSVKLDLASEFQKRIGRKGLDQRHARVAIASGVFPYLRKTMIKDLFESFYAQMDKVRVHWTAHSQHGELLRSFQEIGGLEYCPKEQREKIVKWLTLTFLGEKGGRTIYGNIRHVYYSNSAAPLIKNIISDSKPIIAEELKNLANDSIVKKHCKNTHIARRFEILLDLVENDG